jgi:hypothetical protein
MHTFTEATYHRRTSPQQFGETKGFKQQKNQVGWAILTHNLWVVAKKFIAEEDPSLAIAA